MINKNIKGFSLLEVLISIAILLVGVSSAYYLISLSVQSATISQNRIVAAMLAQEGVELIRTIRDNNWHRDAQGIPTIWNANLSNGNYTITYNLSLAAITPPGPFLQKDSATGLYQYTTGQNTIFRRTINLVNISANEVRIISTVNWTEGLISKSLQAEDHLFNWK